MSSRKKQRVRYAVVGLGWIAQESVLPAFAHASENSELAALVSTDDVKLRTLGKDYGIDRLYTADEYRDCLESGDIDAVYIALPNDMHREATILAARAGVHVLCEKPLAGTSADCRAMIKACVEGGVRLMTAYRLHFEPSNIACMEAVREDIGEPRIFSADFCTPVRRQDNIRLAAERGGGTLPDIGIYCINAARYLFRDEPVEAWATTASRDLERFAEVPEMTSVVLRFPGERLAHFTASFGAASVSRLQVIGTKGDVRLDPAFSHAGPRTMRLTVDGQTTTRAFPAHDQFAPELVHFSQCVLERRDPVPSGLEGLIDVAIIEALEAAIRSGRPIRLDLPERSRRPGRRLEMRKPPARKPRLVRAGHPAGASR